MRLNAPLALPFGTAVPFTVIVVAVVEVGVTVTDVTEFATLTVYDIVLALKAGVSVPDEIWRFDKVGAVAAAARVTVTV